MQEVFWQIDKDKSGTLEPTELREALLKLGIPVPGEADFQALFDASDINKHGHIDYVEFVATMLDSDRVARWAGVDWHGCLKAPLCKPLSWTRLGDFGWAVSSLGIALWLWQKILCQRPRDRAELPPSPCKFGSSTGHQSWQHVGRTAKGPSCSLQPIAVARLALKQPLDWADEMETAILGCVLPTAWPTLCGVSYAQCDQTWPRCTLQGLVMQAQWPAAQGLCPV